MSFTCFYIILFIISFLYTSQTLSREKEARLHERVKQHNELNLQYRNAQCCKKNLKCCQLPNVPNLEIRAVLVRCPNVKPCAVDPSMRRGKEPICEAKEHPIKQYHGFDEDEPISEYSLQKCRQKLMLTIKISKHEFNPNQNQYVIVDHVFDHNTGNYSRILSPYVIKFNQEPIMQLYKLRFLHVVNSKVRERVFSKKNVQNFTGCDITSGHPTCGKITYNGKIIPYSPGFCCSCDPYTNYLRQPSQINQYSSDEVNYGDPAFLLGGIECPRNIKGGDIINDAEDLLDESKKASADRGESDQTNTGGDELWESPLRKLKYHPLLPNSMTIKKPHSEKNYTVKIFSADGDFYRAQALPSSFVDDFSEEIPLEKVQEATMDFIDEQNSKTLNEEIENLNSVLRARKSLDERVNRRQVQVGGTQKRGGQNCADRYTPKNVNPLTYHESAHCLKFSDIWYTVYRLEQPLIQHSFTIQLFEKQFGTNGQTIWKDLTKSKKSRVSTLTPQFVDPNGSYAIQFFPRIGKIEPSTFAVNYRAAVLLVPEQSSPTLIKKYPETQGGPSEYLILHASQVSVDGDQCNLAGVGFEAFFKQPNRCAKIQGSCLKNQPYDLWLHDHQAEKQKLRGCFFLKNFAKVPVDPIRQYVKTSPDKYLFLEYKHPPFSKLNIEIKADFNTILKKQSAARITEVYVDNGTRGQVVVIVKITNSGLSSSKFMTKMTDCPLELPTFFNNIYSKLVLIPPQHQHVFRMVIKCELPVDSFHCSIEALNYKQELVALRRIRLQKFDRCVCAWHCLCACTGSSEGIGCVPMSMQHYHAAGFQGSLPISSFTIHYSFFDDAISLIMYILISVIVILLLLGLCKALMGICCCDVIGIFGLDVIMDLPKPIKKYYESNLKDKKVKFDRDGWPIHPETRVRVRTISRTAEFCINIVFFFAYPCCITLQLCQRICFPQSGKKWEQNDEKCECEDEPTNRRRSIIVKRGQNAEQRNSTRQRTNKKSNEREVRLSTVISIREDSDKFTDSETETVKSLDVVEEDAGVESETEAESDADVDAETKTEGDAEDDTEACTETGTEVDAETDTVADTTAATEVDTAAETENEPTAQEESTTDTQTEESSIKTITIEDAEDEIIKVDHEDENESVE